MFERAFEEDLRICWLLYRDSQGRSRVLEHLSRCTAGDRDKVLARMMEFARLGNWDARVGFVKRLALEKRLDEFPILEVKSHQDRVLFFRVETCAVAFDAFKKKDDWSKKDQRQLEAAVVVARAARRERGGNR